MAAKVRGAFESIFAHEIFGYWKKYGKKYEMVVSYRNYNTFIWL